MSLELGIETDTIKLALKEFEGVNRRFSLLHKYKGIKIFDDYGHHPVEINSALAAARLLALCSPIPICTPSNILFRNEKVVGRSGEFL
mgnify:CR=1 FL=1